MVVRPEALVSVCGVAAAVGLAMPARAAAVRRARRVLGVARVGRSATRAERQVGNFTTASVVHGVAALGVLGLSVVLVGGVPGVLTGLVAAWVARAALRRAASPADPAVQARLAAELPMVSDLLATCLECGVTPARAVHTVAVALGRPWSDLLLPPLAAARLGADPRRCWQALAADPTTAPLADALARAADDGVALVPLLRALAADRRRERRSAARRRAQRVGVLALGPLGACFLPAFVLVGVVPVVVSVGRHVLGGLL